MYEQRIPLPVIKGITETSFMKEKYVYIYGNDQEKVIYHEK